MYGLARALDAAAETLKGTSSMAANARALAALAKEFRERSVALPPVVVADAAPSTVDSADEVARKRAERRNQGKATG